MYFTGNFGYQNFLVFTPVFNSVTLGNDKKNVTNWIPTGISPEKIKPFDFSLVPIMYSLWNSRIIL